MITKLFIPVAILSLSACAAQPVSMQDYRPVIDPARVDQASFEKDLPECRKIGEEVYQKAYEQYQNEVVASILLGAAVGAAGGAMIDGDYAGAGAVGGATGAAAGTVYRAGDLQRGPKAIVDRCLSNRGHEILASG
ncbi:glycine zipper family protein [Roseovarius ramblicola]|uniref:Glycine zipper family protein n=1 Tax=Roseovarius ramblicola TaxID=2022336 RepID=A0ABV5HYB3_9RHOB